MRQAFQYATGADLDVASMGARHGKHIFRAASFGLTSQGRPINNTFAINLAIRKAAAAPGGGTVVIPEGIYPVYTIVLASHVTLHLEKNAILRAARPDPSLARGTRGHGENGNVLPPEANPMAGPQDGGHSHFANSLIYGHDLEDIAVTGEGALESFLDGSSLHEKGRTGPTEYILRTDDQARALRYLVWKQGRCPCPLQGCFPRGLWRPHRRALCVHAGGLPECVRLSCCS